MYKLKILINSDGDFYYENPEFMTNNLEHIFYYNKRKDAVEDLKGVYSKLVNTIKVSKESLKGIILALKEFEPLAYKVADKIDTFYFNMNFGNQEIHFTLVKTEKIETSKGHYYEDEKVKFEFYNVNSSNGNYNWDVLEEFEDVKEVCR